MAYCVRFKCDQSYSEIPEKWLIDNNRCWWPAKTKNPVSLMSKDVQPSSCNDMWEIFEIEVEKHCSNLLSARKYASNIDYASTDNDDQKGRGKRRKKKSQYISLQSDDSDSDQEQRAYSPPPKLKKKEAASSSKNTSLSPASLEKNTQQIVNIRELPIVTEDQITIISDDYYAVDTILTQESNVLSFSSTSAPLTSTSAPLASTSDASPSTSAASTLITSTAVERNQDDLNSKYLNLCTLIKLSLKNIEERLTRIEEGRSKTKDVEHFERIEELLPINSVETLNKLEILLQESNMKDKFRSFLSAVGGRDSKDFCIRILKRMFTNEFAKKCSWLGHRNNIRVCDWQCIKIIQRLLVSEFHDCKEATVDIVGSEWFRQAGLRLKRETAQK